ncbi:unnamed protein product [Cyprideis torosa]|uniref:isopentenyl-diphosphate Delta-isomerase n=1 Tax=Cyprideis torosa TaxID=163714 RepID=A0A7R8WUZ6_9CRUS|nr:unnamed protein product [Cyprideis torosa]CAG0909873.1 unnamed protein product [Cyprideis torosa]
MSNREEQVVLVNEEDQVLDLMGKQEAHEKGLLHRAISIIVFNSKGNMLVQQRSDAKYHWAGIWSNTVCTHPRNDESYADAAQRRLFEELGFNTPLTEQFSFIYKATDEQSGKYDGPIPFNKDEVKAVKWMSTEELETQLKAHPEQFSFWFKIILKEMKARNL